MAQALNLPTSKSKRSTATSTSAASRNARVRARSDTRSAPPFRRCRLLRTILAIGRRGLHIALNYGKTVAIRSADSRREPAISGQR